MPSSPLVRRPERASSPLASLVSEPEQASSPLGKVPPILCPLPSSEPITGAGNPSGEDGDQPLAAMPIAVWNASSDNAKSPPGRWRCRREQKQKLVETRILCFPTLDWRPVPSHPSSRILTLEGRRSCRLTKLWHYPFRDSLR